LKTKDAAASLSASIRLRKRAHPKQQPQRLPHRATAQHKFINATPAQSLFSSSVGVAFDFGIRIADLKESFFCNPQSEI
jgi:hypothetical protein